jgi:hypothetical protein
MDVEHLTGHMAQHTVAIRAVVQGITDPQARTRPDPSSWSMLEVINHLWDEEIEDFKTHLDYTLHRPGERWPEIDPGPWVTQRGYNQRGWAVSLEGFFRERDMSLGWLRGLSSPDWEASYSAPWGPITAGDLLAAWVAHDILHLRQLVELRWVLIASELKPRSVAYAGEW